MIDIVSALAEDREIRALILNQALPGTSAAVDKFKETRDDVFIVYCTVHDVIKNVSSRANLIFELNELDAGKAMVKQAKKQGAKVFVHHSISRHMSNPILLSRCNHILEACVAEGMQFVNSTVPDPIAETGFAEAKRFIYEDVAKLVARYGDDTAFFCTNCSLQVPLIRAVVDNHAIYPQPCCPSPFHGIPEALGIDANVSHTDIGYVVNEACRIAAEKNMSDRLSTWPLSASMLFSCTGAEYAIKWINGLVPKTQIDDRVLEVCLNECIKEIVGEGVEVEIAEYVENGITYSNFKLLLMSYLDF